MAVPYTFASATGSIPLSQLDTNFATAIVIGNTSVYLGNTITTLNNITLANATISSVVFASGASLANVTLTGTTTVSGNITVSGNSTVSGTGIFNGNITVSGTSTVSGNSVVSTNLLVAQTSNANPGAVSSVSNSMNPIVGANAWKQAAFQASGAYGGAVSLVNTGGGSDGFVINLTNNPSQLNINYGANGGTTNGYGVTLTSTATSWSSFSDERLKTDLNPIVNASQKSSLFRTVTGRYKTDPEGTVRNFLIAQDVLPVVPSAVSTDEKGYLILSKDELIPLLFATVNELSARVAALEAKP
jgi:Chaperone of endosialidase